MSLEIILLSSINIILSVEWLLTENVGFTVFQKDLLSLTKLEFKVTQPLSNIFFQDVIFNSNIYVKSSLYKLTSE